MGKYPMPSVSGLFTLYGRTAMFNLNPPLKYGNIILSLLHIFIVIIMMASTTMSLAVESSPFNFEKSQAKIKDLSRQLKDGLVSTQQMESAKQQTEQFSQGAAVCIDSSANQIGRLEQELASLGPNTDHEPVEIIKERKSLTKQKQALQVTLSECRLIATLATRLQNELNDQNKILQTANFFSKTQNFFGRMAQSLPTSAEFDDQLLQYIANQSGWEDLIETLLFLAASGAGLLGGLKLSTIIQVYLRTSSNATESKSPSADIGRKELPLACAALLGGCYLLYLHRNAPSMVYGPWLLFSVGIYCLVLFLFHLGNAKAQLTDGPALIPVFRFRLLVFLGVFLFFSTHLDLSDFRALETILVLFQSAIIAVLCLVGLWCLWSLRIPQRIVQFKKPIRIGISAFSILIVIVELSGYRNFSIFLLLGCFGSLLLFNFLRLFLFLIDEIIGGFLSGKYQWQQKLRLRLGLSSTEALPGLLWLRLICKLLAWSLAAFIFLQLWGLSDSQRKHITTNLINGINLGGLTIAPARIIMGFLAFALGWTLISWVKMRLDKKWLRHSHFSRSAKETLVTMTGYAGFALILVIGLTVAGVRFSNLAVIAGALSVGIGFGLQNIVNNFVSGLIILFERPVKRGDWISVGNTEGYVQKISVRSTLIQTFDRSDVIVPNSELISNQVTNMMLNDNHGRLIVPIGVAYGSDTDLVRTILLDIANANDKIINDGSAPKPQVLFMEFGESSLNFELRCHLANIDERLLVRSAINYEIDRAFRKHNISIPFPQRDLYIKEFPQAGRKASDE
jgi:potassium-dependent mechanosensitive channel